MNPIIFSNINVNIEKEYTILRPAFVRCVKTTL